MVWSRICVSTNAWVTLRLLTRGPYFENHGSAKQRRKCAYFEDMTHELPASPLSSPLPFFPSSFIVYVLLEHRVWAGLTR